MTIYSLEVLLSQSGTTLGSMSSSNCCFLTCIQVSQEAGQVVWYSYLLKNFPELVVVHTVKGFDTVNKAEVDVFLELSCFFNDPTDVGNLISGSSVFSKTSLNIWKFIVHVLLRPGLTFFRIEYSGLFSFRIDWFLSPCCPRETQKSFTAPQLENIHSLVCCLLYG